MCRVTTLSEKLEQVINLQDVNVSLPAKLFSRFSFSKDLENIMSLFALKWKSKTELLKFI